jgi:hypothetical protein
LQCTIKVMVRGAKISGTDFYGNEGACYRSRPRLIRHSRKDEFRAGAPTPQSRRSSPGQLAGLVQGEMDQAFLALR